MKRGSRTILTVVVTIVVLVCIAVAVGFVVVFSGVISVAATTSDLPIVAWVLDTTMEHSVEAHARDVIVPADYSNADLRAGHHHYNSMCVFCHGAPGVERRWVGESLSPYPPDLTVAANDWTPAEVFWIIDHGIKMTGMPAMGPSHSESEVWTLAAFVKSLPKMTPEQYKAFGQSGEGGDTGQSRQAGEPGR
jgi:mono/diheme cytochrome c family protein